MTTIYDPIKYQRLSVERARNPKAIITESEQHARENDPDTSRNDHLPFRYGWVTSTLCSVIKDLLVAIDILEQQNKEIIEQNISLSSVVDTAVRNHNDIVLIGDTRWDDDERLYEVVQIVRAQRRSDDIAIVVYKDDGEKAERRVALAEDDILESRDV